MSDEMTVAELMGMLEDEPGDAIVRIVHQQSWPLQETVGGIALSSDLHGVEPDEDEQDAVDEGDPVVYLVADGHPWDDSPYGSKNAWEVMRRR